MTEEDQQDSATMARFNLPEYATDPAIGFYMEWLAVAEFLTAHFMGTGVLGMIAYLFKTGFSTIARSRESVHTAEPAAEGSEQRGIDRGDAQEGGEDSDGNDPLHVLRHVQLIAEMTLVRLVDYYLVYLTELLAMISRTRPHRLPHDRQISFGQVLQYENMDELRRAIADQYVRELILNLGEHMLFPPIRRFSATSGSAFRLGCGWVAVGAHGSAG